jgi:hypothetical protein
MINYKFHRSHIGAKVLEEHTASICRQPAKTEEDLSPKRITSMALHKGPISVAPSNRL